MRDKSKRQIVIYFDTVEDKDKFQAEARRYGMTMSKLAWMSMGVGKPIVLRSLRSMKRQQNQAVKPVSE